MKTKLILLTANFPFCKGEPFLANELPHLANNFDKVEIISTGLGGEIQIKLAENFTVNRVNLSLNSLEKLITLKGLFSKIVWTEFSIIRKKYKLKISKKILSTVLISKAKAKIMKEFTEEIIERDKSEYSCYFYSYWCDDSALSLAFLKDDYPEAICFSRMHGWDVYFEASKINYLPFRTKINDSLNRLFAISEKGKVYANDIWKTNRPERIGVSRLGVPAQIYSTEKLITEEKLIVSCSNLIPLKRIHLLIESLALTKLDNLKWVHFGEGDLLSELKEMAGEYLTGKVKYEFKGQKENAEILNFYRNEKPDLFINVSSSEGIPVSIMEAMSFGIPVIATNVGGTSEIVSNENGILLQENPNPENIKYAIEEFLNLSKTEMAEKAKKSYNTWKKSYNAEINYNQFVLEILELKNL